MNVVSNSRMKIGKIERTNNKTLKAHQTHTYTPVHALNALKANKNAGFAREDNRREKIIGGKI